MMCAIFALLGLIYYFGPDADQDWAWITMDYASRVVPPLRRFVTAAAGTFHALRTPILAGREFTWRYTYRFYTVPAVKDVGK